MSQSSHRWLRSAMLAALVCQLGWIPRASAALKSDEAVMFFPAVAWPCSNGWRIELRGKIYEPGSHPLQATVMRRLLGLDDEGWTEVQRALFRTRIESFLVDNERRKVLLIELGGNTVRSEKSEPNGQFKAQVILGSEQARRRGIGVEGGTFHLTGSVATSSGTNLAVPLQIHFIGPKGWSVISDIDDTIKISHVRDRRALVHATFCEPFQAVPGMASAYQTWASAGCQFHYVSASPWQLYPSLDAFLGTNRFPEGTFHMKSVRLKDSSVADIFGPQHRYKSAEISALLKRAPERRFVLVGDSGEQDPEIYGELARQRPNQIAHILIRNVTDEGSDAPRYRECFRSLPTELWTIFQDARILEHLPLRVR